MDLPGVKGILINIYIIVEQRLYLWSSMRTNFNVLRNEQELFGWERRAVSFLQVFFLEALEKKRRLDRQKKRVVHLGQRFVTGGRPIVFFRQRVASGTR